MHRRNLSEAIERYHLRYPQEIEAVQRFRNYWPSTPTALNAPAGPGI